MKLGLVTYNLAKDWDIPAIIQKCEATGFEAVELRTTHAHGVEPTLSASQRQEVKRQFANSKVRLLSLGSTCEYHAADQEIVRKNVEETKEFVKLAADVGAIGVKVRPNGFSDPKLGIPKEETLKQIGRALSECGEFAQPNNVGIWLEVHGRETCELSNIKTILDFTNHPSVGVCWNSNGTDIKNGSIKENFDLVRNSIRNVHINELCNPSYPWRELFQLLQKSGYEGYCLAEVASSSDPDRLMRYYKALWLELCSPS
jgi:sugar phosphate isomerase/epimerase